MSNSTASGLSPAIPFQLLPSSVAFQLQIKSYIFAGASGIFVWDILSNLTADWNLFRLAKNRYALAAYTLSRLGAITYVIGRTVYATYPVGNCKLGDIAVDCFFPVGIAGSCFLFFLRARAVYMNRLYIVAIFAFLWLSVLAACITVPFGTVSDSINIEDTPYCVTVATEDFAKAAVIVPTVYDTVIFLAISYKLMSYGFSDNHGFRHRILGTNLPAFSRAMLRDGQKYYLVTVLSNLVTIALGCSPVNPAYQSVFTVPNMMLTNIMACYVYRHTVLGNIRDPAITMDADVFPTVREQNVLPLTTNHAFMEGKNCNPAAIDGIIVQMSSITHVDEVHKFKPEVFTSSL